MLSLGLCRAWSRVGIVVKPFKKGPDYIDAAWLSMAAGIQATNLDPFFMDTAGLKELFITAMLAPRAAIGIIEGNRGIFDGLNESGVCSTAQLMRTLDCPIALCLDCAKATRTMAAIINGLTCFEEGLSFAGVILNRIGSSRHELSLRRAIEANTSLPVLGALPRLESNPLPERHMGLASRGAELNRDSDTILERIADFVSENCDLGAIMAAACVAPPMDPIKMPAISRNSAKSPRIGVVRDQALWFYYPENIAALQQEGAEIVWLSLFDRQNPGWGNIDAIYLGGGFPEDFAPGISASTCLPLLADYAAKGMPIYAECGGLIVLCTEFRRNGKSWPMANVFPLSVNWHAKPQGLGYVEATVRKKNPYYSQGTILRGHEFHYSSCTFNGIAPEMLLTLRRGTGIYRGDEAFDGLLKNNVWASYTHIFAPSTPEWAKNFVKIARNHLMQD